MFLKPMGGRAGLKSPAESVFISCSSFSPSYLPDPGNATHRKRRKLHPRVQIRRLREEGIALAFRGLPCHPCSCPTPSEIPTPSSKSLLHLVLPWAFTLPSPSEGVGSWRTQAVGWGLGRGTVKCCYLHRGCCGLLHNKKKMQTVRHACVPSPLHFYRIHLSDSRKWLHVGLVFLSLLQTTGFREPQQTVLLFTELSEEIVQFLTKSLGLPGSPSSENGESQPKRHRNQDLPSSQDVKPSKEAETSQRERQGPSGNTDHSLTHTRAICPALGAS